MDDVYRPLYRNNRGPRSAAGKAAGAFHNVRHGLLSRQAALPDEDEAEWIRFRDAVAASLGAVGFVETALASRVAMALWRLRRIPAVEAAAMATASIPPASITTYEAMLDRRLRQSLDQLHVMQYARLGKRPRRRFELDTEA